MWLTWPIKCIAQSADLHAVTEGNMCLPLWRVTFCLLCTFKMSWRGSAVVVFSRQATDWLFLRYVVSRRKHLDTLADKSEHPNMIFATWIALRSLFDSLLVLEVADVWLKANFSWALESKWKRHVFYGWLAGLISKAVFSVHVQSFCFVNRKEKRLSTQARTKNLNLNLIAYFDCPSPFFFCSTQLNLTWDFESFTDDK